MKYVIGIDGGGTKSLLKLADLDGVVRYEAKGGPTNIYATSVETVRADLVELIHRTLQGAGVAIEDCGALCLGSAGVDRPYEKEVLGGIFRDIGVQGPLTITNDAEIALVGGSGQQEGVVIISGTGSFGFGRDFAGNKARAGGWGHMIGGEGSGYYIGIKGLIAAVRSQDGREPATELLPMMMREIGIESVDKFYHYVYKQAEMKDISELARVVDAAYKLGDAKAKAILADAASELYLMAHTIIGKLGFEHKAIPVVANGSAVEKIEFVFDEFARQVKSAHPLADVMRPKRDAAIGAVLMALDSL